MGSSASGSEITPDKIVMTVVDQGTRPNGERGSLHYRGPPSPSQEGFHELSGEAEILSPIYKENIYEAAEARKEFLATELPMSSSRAPFGADVPLPPDQTSKDSPREARSDVSGFLASSEAADYEPGAGWMASSESGFDVGAYVLGDVMMFSEWSGGVFVV